MLFFYFFSWASKIKCMISRIVLMAALSPSTFYTFYEKCVCDPRGREHDFTKTCACHSGLPPRRFLGKMPYSAKVLLTVLGFYQKYACSCTVFSAIKLLLLMNMPVHLATPNRSYRFLESNSSDPVRREGDESHDPRKAKGGSHFCVWVWLHCLRRETTAAPPSKWLCNASDLSIFQIFCTLFFCRGIERHIMGDLEVPRSKPPLDVWKILAKWAKLTVRPKCLWLGFSAAILFFDNLQMVNVWMWNLVT